MPTLVSGTWTSEVICENDSVRKSLKHWFSWSIGCRPCVVLGGKYTITISSFLATACALAVTWNGQQDDLVLVLLQLGSEVRRLPNTLRQIWRYGDTDIFTA